jgi:hypothetical protein
MIMSSKYNSIGVNNIFSNMLKNVKTKEPISSHNSRYSPIKTSQITGLPKNNISIQENNNIKVIEDPTLGFILTRHVNSEQTNLYWVECIQQIKKFYPISKIVIIDDNSNPLFLDDSQFNGLNMENCQVLQSEFKGRGEILPYYYFYKNHFFEKAVIIHDSVFIQAPVDFSSVKNIKPLWTFNGKYIENYLIERLMLSKLKNNEGLLELHSNTKSWNGCFGVMSVVSYDFIKLLNDKYNLFSIMSLIDSRMKRCCLERIFGIICQSTLITVESDSYSPIFGNINDFIPHNKYSFSEYLRDKQLNKIPRNIPFVKVFSGR